MAELVKRLLSTPKVSGSNHRQEKQIQSHFEYLSAILRKSSCKIKFLGFSSNISVRISPIDQSAARPIFIKDIEALLMDNSSKNNSITHSTLLITHDNLYTQMTVFFI